MHKFQNSPYQEKNTYENCQKRLTSSTCLYRKPRFYNNINTRKNKRFFLDFRVFINNNINNISIILGFLPRIHRNKIGIIIL